MRRFNLILFFSHFNLFFSGATHSTVIICDQNGKIVSKVTGPGSNHWICGIPEVARRVSEMIGRAKTAANIDVTSKLRALGLSLSGCEQVSCPQTICRHLKQWSMMNEKLNSFRLKHFH